MAFLGTLLTMISGGVLFADTCKTASIERQSREQAEREGRNVWVDNKGNYRLVGTNEKCYITYDNKLKSLKDGRVVINYNDIKINRINEESIAKAKAEGLKGCEILYKQYSKPGEKERRYYTEFSTGKRYYLHINIFDNPEKYYVCYYTENKPGISSLLTDWKDERREVTVEEYRSYGGYTSCKEGQGKYYS